MLNFFTIGCKNYTSFFLCGMCKIYLKYHRYFSAILFISEINKYKGSDNEEIHQTLRQSYFLFDFVVKDKKFQQIPNAQQYLIISVNLATLMT